MIYECHGHIVLDGVSYEGAVSRHKNGTDEAFVRFNLKTCAEHGILFYRDGGDKFGAAVLAKTIANEYGIDYRMPAFIIHKKGYYGRMFGRAFEDIHGYRSLVAEAKRLGADFIKATASGILDFAGDGGVTGPEMALSELIEIVKIAHGEGFAVMIHANGADNIKRAAEAGADSIEHGFFMDSDALRILAHTGAIWVPTCTTVLNLVGSGRYDDDVLRKILDGHRAALRAASDIGVPVACGSDAGAVGVPQGAGTIDELEFIKSLGIDPEAGNRKIEEVFKKC